MFLALLPVAALLAALLVFSAAMKLTGKPDVVASYARVGVPARRLPAMAGVLVAGAAGLSAGLVWPPIGIAAAACLGAYFVLALVAHARHHDLRHAGTPALMLLLAVACLVLRALSA
ncbi:MULTISPECIES: DoxX family protein [unclassified Spirillospora]|uniref:DoxX family protein n=1 Tax=unclassified Spirillospora TaxID=2642701 RepID=UPI00371275AC